MDVVTLHLAAPGLYVATPRFEFSLPSTITEPLKDGEKTIKDLITVKIKPT